MTGGGWFTDLSLSAKTTLTFALLVLSYVLIGTAFQATQNYQVGARGDAIAVYDNLDHAANVEAETLLMLRALRNALLNQDIQWRRDFQAALRRYDEALVALRRGVETDARQRERVDQIDQVVNAWQAQVAGPAMELLTRRELDDAPLRFDTINQMATEADRVLGALRPVLAELKVHARQDLAQRNAQVARANRMATFAAQGCTLLGLLAALIGWRTSRMHLVTPIDRLTGCIERVAAGDGTVEVPYSERRDEVGSFARALATLQQAVGALAHSNWLRSQLTRARDALQTCTTHEQFAATLLRHLADGSGAVFGLSYRWDDESGKLWWCAGRSVAEDDVHGRDRFVPGQGLVGQCYVDARPIVISPVPAAHVGMVSGVGRSPPDTLLLLPLAARGEVVAVIELGFIGAPSPQARDFLDEATEAAAMAWLTLARSLRTQELLDMSQAQAEALQLSEEALRDQQEELRSANEALRERTLMLELQQRRLETQQEALREQTEELTSANRALADASRYKSEFLANMSHELRTPLNSLLILSKSLADNEEGNLSEDQLQSARIVHESGRSLLNLINDILDLSKVEAGKMTVTFEAVALAGLARDVERNFRHVAQERGLRFEVRLAPGLPEAIRSDATRLMQILANLLSNALKFTHAGAVTLDVRRPDPELLARLVGWAGAPGVAFGVSDSGIGIDRERLERVFQPFEQADGSTSRRYGGTGLGLSIVRGLAELLGGRILVDSNPGSGSVFTLVLPEDGSGTSLEQRPPALDSAVSATHANGVEDGPFDVLIVEDDPLFASLLADIAERCGCSVRVAHSATEALAMTRRRRPHGVLLDLGLPDMDGQQLVAALQAGVGDAPLPVHVISGADPDGASGVAGTVGYLRKPVTQDAVMAALRRVGAGRATRRALLIDDDAGSRAAVRRLLQHQIGDLVEAESGLDGLRRLRDDGPFDCIVLDLGLPDISGFEWLERVDRDALPPVVVYSGRELDADDERRLLQTAASIVVKGSRTEQRLTDEVSRFIARLRVPSVAPDPAVATPASASQPPPAAQPADAGTGAAEAASNEALQGLRVLVVDDDMRNVFALSRTLSQRGIEVIKAPDGARALSLLEAQTQVDVVLMDVMMPGMDGYETMRRIRAMPRWADVPIIAVTANAMAGDREKCTEAGASDYCPKPIDVEGLLRQIHRWTRA